MALAQAAAPVATAPRGSARAIVALRILVALTLFAGRDVPGRVFSVARQAVETSLGPAGVPPRAAAWARALAPIDVSNVTTRASATLSLYDDEGDVDEQNREAFERVASREGEPHRLARRVEQLVFKAAYHFGARHLFIVSGWRLNAGRHGKGEALDFKLQGVRASELAAYLRGLPRVGVGLYTHPDTQFVHVDVRDVSFHWLDASPPGVKWRERALRDPRGAKRDETYSPDMDLP